MHLMLEMDVARAQPRRICLDIAQSIRLDVYSLSQRCKPWFAAEMVRRVVVEVRGEMQLCKPATSTTDLLFL